MRHETALVDLGQVLEFRHLGNHHRRVDDTALGLDADLFGRQRAAHAANVPFRLVAHIRKRAVAKTAAKHQLSHAVGQ
ncbi:hypothetical protein D3C86_2011150 [compost metagenome]